MADKIQAIDLRSSRERQKLQDIIPLTTPFSLYIEPTSLCNMRCAFCPTGDRLLRKRRSNGIMQLELFEKIVGDIGKLGVKLKRVNLYKDGEPLVNQDFPEMVQILRKANVTESIWTKTNGLALEPELNQKLIDSGIDLIGISIQHVHREGYQRIADVKIDYEKFLANIADLYHRRRNCKIYIKIADSGLTKSEIDKFYKDFTPVADFVAIEQLHGWSASDVKDFTLGTNPVTFEGYPLLDRVVCPLPFYMLGINWNGTVSLCNEDWMHATIVGDLKTQSLLEIWNGKALYNARKLHLQGRRNELPMCTNCYYLKTLPDNIDVYREELLKRLE